MGGFLILIFFWVGLSGLLGEREQGFEREEPNPKIVKLYLIKKKKKWAKGAGPLEPPPGFIPGQK